MEPDDYAGLELWYKDTGFWQDSARTTPATAHGDPIGAWDDQSGNARHMTQATSGNRPTLDTTGVGGHDAVNFDAGSSQYLNIPNVLTGFTVGEIFMVLRPAADPSGGATGGGAWGLGSVESGVHGDVWPWSDGNVYVGAMSNAVKINPGNPAWPVNLVQWHLVHIFSKSADWFCRCNTSQVSRTSTNTVGFTTAPTIGASMLLARKYSGKFVEIFLYSQERTEAERAVLREYVNSRYGLWTTNVMEKEQPSVIHPDTEQIGTFGFGITG